MICRSCGVAYDGSMSAFCPHSGAAQVTGPSIAAASRPASVLEAAQQEVVSRLVGAGASVADFAIWTDLAPIQSPLGPEEGLPEVTALHLSAHTDVARAAIERLPNALAGIDIHYHEEGI